MVDISRNAQGVLAWLHPENEAIERGMRYLDHLSRRAKVSMTGPEIKGLVAHRLRGDENDMAGKFAGVVMFFRLPYFQRL